MTRWRVLLVVFVSLSTLSAVTAVEAPKMNAGADIATWLLAVGWLALAFGLGMAFQRVANLHDWLHSVAGRVAALEKNSASVAVLTERVDGLREDMSAVKEALEEIRGAVAIPRARSARA